MKIEVHDIKDDRDQHNKDKFGGDPRIIGIIIVNIPKDKENDFFHPNENGQSDNFERIIVETLVESESTVL